MNLSSERKRQPRADRGMIRHKERDNKLLQFIAEQRAVNSKMLQYVMDLSKSSVSAWLARMEERGCLGKVGQGESNGPFYYVTARGMRQVNLSYAVSTPEQLAHTHAVVTARLFLQGVRRVLPQANDWISERSLRSQHKQNRTDDHGVHFQDGLVFEWGGFDNDSDSSCGWCAVEVELSPKTLSHTVNIIKMLGYEHSRIYYVVSRRSKHRVEESIEAARAQGSIAPGCKIQVLLLDDCEAALARDYEQSSLERIAAWKEQQRRRQEAQAPTPSTSSILLSPSLSPGSQIKAEDIAIIAEALERDIASMAATAQFSRAIAVAGAADHLFESTEGQGHQQLAWRFRWRHIQLLHDLNRPTEAAPQFQQLLDRMSDAMPGGADNMTYASVALWLNRWSLSDETGSLPALPANDPDHTKNLLRFLELVGDSRTSAVVGQNMGALLEARNECEHACQWFKYCLSAIASWQELVWEADLYRALARVSMLCGDTTSAHLYSEQAKWCLV